MVDILALGGSLYDTLKKAKELSDKLANTELRLMIADLQSTGAELRIQLAQQVDHIGQLEQELRDLRGTIAVAARLVRAGDVYHLQEAQGATLQGLYCPVCFDGERKLISLIAAKGHVGGGPMARLTLFCGRCRNHFCRPRQRD